MEDDYFITEEVPRPQGLRDLGRCPGNKDFWEVLPQQGILRWHHSRWRTHPFSPWEGARIPVPLEQLSSERKTHKVSKAGDQSQHQDDWRSLRPTKRSSGKWKGHTDFYLTVEATRTWCAELQGQLEGSEYYSHLSPDLSDKASKTYSYAVLADEIFLSKRVASDEVLDRDIRPEDREAWAVADGEEWAKIVASGCMKLLSVEESRRVVDDLKAQGKQDRVLQTRMVRRLKPGEQVGDTPSFKSRLCIR